MILLKSEIIENIYNGKITGNGNLLDINKLHINPNSIDVHLDKKLKVYFEPFIEETTYNNKIYKILRAKEIFDFPVILDPKEKNKTYEIEIPEEGLVLLPNNLYLANTVEAIGSKHFIPMYEGRSSMARLGIKSHISAGFGDIGFDGQWTLEIEVTHPVKIYPNMRIGQVYFIKVNENKINNNLYNGKYVNSKGTIESLSYKDF